MHSQDYHFLCFGDGKKAVPLTPSIARDWATEHLRLVRKTQSLPAGVAMKIVRLMLLNGGSCKARDSVSLRFYPLWIAYRALNQRPEFVWSALLYVSHYKDRNICFFPLYGPILSAWRSGNYSKAQCLEAGVLYHLFWNMNVSKIVDPCPTTRWTIFLLTLLRLWFIFFFLFFFSCFSVMPPTLILLHLHSLLSGTFYISLWTKALLEMTKPLSRLRDCNSVLKIMPQEDFLITLYSKRDLDIEWPSVLQPITYLASETLINCVFACAFT